MAYQGKHYGNVGPNAANKGDGSSKSARKEQKQRQKLLKKQQKEQKKRQQQQQPLRQQQPVQNPYQRPMHQPLPSYTTQQETVRSQQVKQKPVKPKQVKPKQPKQKRVRPKLRIRWRRLCAFLLLFVVALAGTGVLGYGFYLQRKMVVPGAALAALPSDRPVNVLLVGLDRDTASYDPLRQQSLNADMILVARLQPSKHTASLLLIPPDTRVPLSDGPDQITHAYAEGGIAQLQQSVTDLTGLSIDRYITVDFNGFAQAIDAVGGIDYNVPSAMTDPEQIVSVQPGNQHLNGRQALTVLRYLQGDPGGVVRAQRDQQLIGMLLSQLQNASTWTWFQGLRAMSDSVQTNLTLMEMSSLLPSVQTSTAQVTMNAVPGSVLNLYGVNYWMADSAKLAQIVQEMQ